MRLVTHAMAEDPSLLLNAALTRLRPRVGRMANTVWGWLKQARIYGLSPRDDNG